MWEECGGIGKCVEVWESVWRCRKMYRGVEKSVEVWESVWRCGEVCGDI